MRLRFLLSIKMPSSSTLFRALALAGCAALSLPVSRGQTAAAGSYPASGDETVKLPAFSVTGTSADPFQAQEEMSASRTAQNIIDTPLTVDVITPALIQDVDPDTIYSVAQYFAGVSPGRGTGSEGINDRMTFRGFESFTRTIDNFAGFLFPSTSADDGQFDPAFVEHAELLMGPDSILAPTGAPGGSINLITKSPQFTPDTWVSAEVGLYDANKYVLDSTGPIGSGDHMAYRVIFDYQDSQTYLPGANRWFSGAAEFTYKFNDKSQLTFKYFGSQETYKGTATLSNLDGEYVYTPNTVGGATISNTPQPGFTYDGWNGDASWSYRTMRDNTVEVELTSALTDHINMRLAGQIYTNATDNVMAFPSATVPETWNPQTGVETGVTAINPNSLPVVGGYEHDTSRQIQLQNDYAGKFDAGGVTLDPVAGWSYQNGETPTNIYIQDHNLPNANLSAGVYNPPVPSLADFTTFVSDTPSSGWLAQAYAYLTAGFFNNRLYLNAGGERTWANVNDYTDHGMELPGLTEFIGSHAAQTDATLAHTGSLLLPSVDDYHDSYMLGALGKILPDLSAYATVSTNASIASGTPIWQSGKEYEFGLKSQLLDNRLTITADHFQISESNVTATNPLYNTGQSTVPFLYQDLNNHGEEINIDGGITNNLSVIISGTLMHLRDPQDRRQRNIPDSMANALLNYRFNTGWLDHSNVFLGIVHEGDVAGETVTGYTKLGVPELPGFYIPAYTVLNAGAGYRPSKKYEFNLNIDNLLNEKFWWQASSRTSLAPYPGLNVRFTITIHLF